MLLAIWPAILPLFDTGRPENLRQMYEEKLPTRLPFDDSLIRRNMEDESLLILLIQ